MKNLVYNLKNLSNLPQRGKISRSRHWEFRKRINKNNWYYYLARVLKKSTDKYWFEIEEIILKKYPNLQGWDLINMRDTLNPLRHNRLDSIMISRGAIFKFDEKGKIYSIPQRRKKLYIKEETPKEHQPSAYKQEFYKKHEPETTSKFYSRPKNFKIIHDFLDSDKRLQYLKSVYTKTILKIEKISNKLDDIFQNHCSKQCDKKKYYQYVGDYGINIIVNFRIKSYITYSVIGSNYIDKYKINLVETMCPDLYYEFLCLHEKTNLLTYEMNSLISELVQTFKKNNYAI